MLKTNWILLILLLIFTVVGLTSCGTKQAPPTDEERLEARGRVPCIVVLPVMADLKSDDSMTYAQAAKLENGASFLDQTIAEAFTGYDNVRLLSQRQLTSLLPENDAAQSVLLTRIGSELKCNAALVTTLSRYEQRVGGEYGADSPASAAFSMKLFNTRDGSLIWSTMFNQTQQSLLSNIMSAYQYGLKWLTVEELVTLGVAEKIKQCPYF
jgi:hypothetical protein